MQTYRFCFTSESTYQLDSSDCKGKERSRTLKALANSHVSQTATCVSFSSHAAHFTHSSRMFAFFLPGQEREWNQSCIVCLLSADSGEGGVTWVCFILCNVFRAQSAISVEILAFPSEYLCPYHKKRLPVLSFPQWQWESWPKILAPAMALPNVLLLPVISDYIIFGNEDIFAFWRSWSDPIPRRWGHEERQTRKLSRQLLSNPNCNSMLTFVKQKKNHHLCANYWVTPKNQVSSTRYPYSRYKLRLQIDMTGTSVEVSGDKALVLGSRGQRSAGP